mgnify:CR=1 FL=1
MFMSRLRFVSDSSFLDRNARFYDSDVARVLSLDPLAGIQPSKTAYHYVAGNPMRMIDPDELEF